MTNTAHDPKTDHSVCLDCNVGLPTARDAADHRRETLDAVKPPFTEGGRSHSTRVVNPTPEEQKANRIRAVVSSEVEDAVGSACEQLELAIDRGRVTRDEVTTALQSYPDFADAWTDWCEEADL